MNYSDFYELMQRCGMVSANWRNVLKLIESSYDDSDMDKYLKILILYFALIDDGNVYMPLSKDVVEKTLKDKADGLIVQAGDDDATKDDEYKNLLAIIGETAQFLNDIRNFSAVSADGKDKMFVVSDDRLYIRKHYNAVAKINKSVERLFTNEAAVSSSFDYKALAVPDFSLSKGQEKILETGIYNNLLITGGPGTGKTTSVFFLLMALLEQDPDYNIFLTAPSGKAASRMKDSIIQSAELIRTGAVNANVEKIKALEEYTIHRLLSYDPIHNNFRYTEETQFATKSIFVIDEASMIDVNIFATLLSAIPTGARVFILGDKNQLPSVECGAVFGGLLARPSLAPNIVTLTESKRFSTGSEIHTLSETINDDGGDLSYIADKWQDPQTFSILSYAEKETPICYYLDNTCKDADLIEPIVVKWYENYWKGTDLQGVCNGVPLPDAEDEASDSIKERFDSIWKTTEDARILCACNKNARGIQSINRLILKKFYADKQKISGFYSGELLIITRNNKTLDLYNGDCGVTVQFKGDDTLYLMLRKGTKLSLDAKKVENKIFKLGDYLFYPIRLISSDDIEPAFAITIHKSQGSDYQNILVILPKSKGHPLLNRQIVYTAITRTKGATYILSNQENLKCAKDTVLKRNTF